MTQESAAPRAPSMLDALIPVITLVGTDATDGFTGINIEHVEPAAGVPGPNGSGPGPAEALAQGDAS